MRTVQRGRRLMDFTCAVLETLPVGLFIWAIWLVT